MKHTVNIREFLEENASCNGRLLVSAEIDLDDLFDNIAEEEEIDVDLREVLAENRQIAHVWSVVDVQALHDDLDDDQAWTVLQAVEKRLDSGRGITWDIVKTVADELFPRKRKHWHGRIEIRIADTDGNGQNEILSRLHDLADLLAKDRPDIQADADPESIRSLDLNETAER